MFFFIIGFGKQTVDDLGTAGMRRCPNCGNTREWRNLRVRSWATLFFIPVIPYGTRTVSRCPICGYEEEAYGV